VGRVWAECGQVGTAATAMSVRGTKYRNTPRCAELRALITVIRALRAAHLAASFNHCLAPEVEMLDDDRRGMSLLTWAASAEKWDLRLWFSWLGAVAA
jgi:hypothetical protein